MRTRVEPYEAGRHLAGLQPLMNRHLAGVVPGWGLTPRYIEARLRGNPEQPVLDPWVIARATLCAVDGDRGEVVAAAHLLRYGRRPEVSDDYRGIATIAWALHLPHRGEAAALLLRAARAQMRAWNARVQAADFDFAGIVDGVPDCWPHVADALAQAGFRRGADTPYSRDAIRLGPLTAVTPEPNPPHPVLEPRHWQGPDTIRWSVSDGPREIGYCQVRSDLTRNGLLPALAPWAEIQDFWVHEEWRDRGVGTWLLSHACGSLLADGRTHAVLLTGDDEESRRAGHLYDRFGWPVATYCDKWWEAEADADGGP